MSWPRWYANTMSNILHCKSDVSSNQACNSSNISIDNNSFGLTTMRTIFEVSEYGDISCATWKLKFWTLQIFYVSDTIICLWTWNVQFNTVLISKLDRHTILASVLPLCMFELSITFKRVKVIKQNFVPLFKTTPTWNYRNFHNFFTAMW